MRSVLIQNTFQGYFHMYYKYFLSWPHQSPGQMSSVPSYARSSPVSPTVTLPSHRELGTASPGGLTECWQVNARLAGGSKTLDAKSHLH